MDQATIRRRLLALRDARRTTQDQLATALGFNDRQTLSEIESGGRPISFSELSSVAAFYGVKLDYFTDPLQLAGEAQFSWRRTLDAGDDLDEFEDRAGGWIAAYRYLSRLKGDSVNSSLTQIGLHSKSSFEEAWTEGEAIARNLELGDIPAAKLAQALEEKWDTLVLFVDAVSGISGAACQLGAMNTILINRRESEGRRNYDLAHEVFHLITWSKMKPMRIEGEVELSKSYNRIEQLAENFAAGLLMPSQSISKYISKSPLPKDGAQVAQWIRAAASLFKVSGDAMKWRLVGLKLLGKTSAMKLDASAIRVSSANETPSRFSRRFVEILGWGIEKGQISVRRASDVVGLSIDDLVDVFSEHGLKAPFDM